LTSVELETRGDVAVLRLSRGRSRNAVDPDMLDQLHRALDSVTSSGAAALVITGQESYFGAGADIQQYVAGDLDLLEAFTRHAGAFCTRLRELPLPVIAAVEGYALGGAFEIVLSCDLVVASTAASFGLPELRLGLIPGWGGTQRLTALIGRTRANHAILTGHRISASEATNWGLISQTCAPGQALATALDTAETLALGPRVATSLAKRAIAAVEHPDPTGLALEVESLMRTFASDDGREGVAAFAERRDPVFGKTHPIAQGREAARAGASIEGTTA
jgi:enoyl-CoA hydratase/carnithine racemase